MNTSLTTKEKKRELYKFESWLNEYEPIIIFHKFKLEFYGSGEYDFYGLCNGEYFFTPEPPKYFIEYLLKHGNGKQKKDGTIKVKIEAGELEDTYNSFKHWYKRVSKVDEILETI